MRQLARFQAGVAAALAAAIAGCPKPPAPELAAPRPLDEAAAIVNANIAQIGGALRATGRVSGYVTTPRGRRVSFSLEGFLIYLRPTYLRFDLKSLAGTELLFGCNAERHWYYSRMEEDGSYYSRPNEGDGLLAEAGIPVHPVQIPDALGLTAIPVDIEANTLSGSMDGELAAQRVINEFQQVLMVRQEGPGRGVVTREFWLDRYPPYLVRRVIFRDEDGVLAMESRLGGYRAVTGSAALAPHEIEADWPQSGTYMRFRVDRWEVRPDVGPDAPPFIPPHELGVRYPNEYVE